MGTTAVGSHEVRSFGGARSFGGVAVRAAIVALALATAWIHASLGGTLFLLNAAGYAALAVGMVVPGPLGQLRPLVRLGLLAFTIVTIAAWVAFGARFELAYIDKGIEVVLVALIALEIQLFDGGPLGLARRIRALFGEAGSAVVSFVNGGS
jgi:hypothetical protein